MQEAAKVQCLPQTGRCSAGTRSRNTPCAHSSRHEWTTLLLGFLPAPQHYQGALHRWPPLALGMVSYLLGKRLFEGQVQQAHP